MAHNAQFFRLGAAEVTLINVGNSQGSLAEMLELPRDQWPSRYVAALEKPAVLPIQCVHIALPQMTLLVDAGAAVPPNSPYAIPDEVPPPGLIEQLTELGLKPEKVEHVVFTHAHFDHLSGALTTQDGQAVPAFPNARYHLGQLDAESEAIREHLEQALPGDNSLEVLQQHEQLDLVAGRTDLGTGIEILPTPGETPGHQALRITSEGETLYCLGDLYHHVLEVEYPNWFASWCDPEAMRASRHSVNEAALGEGAFLIATHIPGVGRLERTAGGTRWVKI